MKTGPHPLSQTILSSTDTTRPKVLALIYIF
jgi:hypothetical protein